LHEPRFDLVWPGQIHHAAIDGEDLAIFAPQAAQECGTGQSFVARDEYALACKSNNNLGGIDTSISL
jgi:hypothetical protein